jgi:hypothetical protein
MARREQEARHASTSIPRAKSGNGRRAFAPFVDRPSTVRRRRCAQFAVATFHLVAQRRYPARPSDPTIRMRDKVLIGYGQGFWGDSILGPVRLVREGPLDYLALDYLAEVTMSIMQKLKGRNPKAGYATDFVAMLDRTLPEIHQKGIKVIANAGGINPKGCAKALEALLAKQGVNLKVAYVEGDDVLPHLDKWKAQGVKEMFTGLALPDKPVSMNVYLGGFPVAAALAKGADVVITGRCVDSAVTLGACIHEFGWTSKDYDKLAGGSLAGHIVECGAQACGGIFTDWDQVPEWENIGYSIADPRIRLS